MMNSGRTAAGLSLPALLACCWGSCRPSCIGVPAASSAANGASYYVDRTVACSDTGAGHHRDAVLHDHQGPGGRAGR